MDRVRTSKTLSYLLRHGAAKQGLAMDAAGYVALRELLPHLPGVSEATVRQVEKTKTKKKEEEEEEEEEEQKKKIKIKKKKKKKK